MEAVVLAGGFGTRLREVVPDLPKPMAPIGGRPFLEVLLTMLAQNGFTRIVLSLGFMAEKIVAHFGDNFLGMELLYVVEDQPLGTGGAARAGLERCVSDHAYIFNGDTYLNLEIDAVENLWASRRKPIIIVREVPDTARYGRIKMSDDGRIVEFLEKGGSGAGYINAGCYVLPRNALNDFPPAHPFSIEKDYIMKHLHNTVFSGFITRSRFIDIGIPEDYARAQIELAEI